MLLHHESIVLRRFGFSQRSYEAARGTSISWAAGPSSGHPCRIAVPNKASPKSRICCWRGTNVC